MVHVVHEKVLLESANAMRKDFCRLRFLCRSAALTRIGEGAGDAKPVGWPGEFRGGILQPKKEFAACGSGMRRSFALKRDPQPSVTPHCPTSASDARYSRFRGRSDKWGCAGRLRSSVCSKLICNGRRRRETSLPIARGCREFHRASQRFSQRQRIPLFEPAPGIGTVTATEYNLLRFQVSYRQESKSAV